MTTTLSTSNRYSVEKFVVPFIETGRPSIDQVPVWLAHGTYPTQSKAHHAATATHNRGIHSRVIDTKTGEVLISASQVRARKDAELHQRARDLTPIPLSVNGMPNGYAWMSAVAETHRQLRAA